MAETPADAVLGELSALSPIPLTVFDLADVLRLGHTQVRTILQDLKARGLVVDKPNETAQQARLYYMPEEADDDRTIREAGGGTTTAVQPRPRIPRAAAGQHPRGPRAGHPLAHGAA